MMNNNIIEVAHLSKSYDNKQVLNDISFDVTRGSIVGIVGPNGAGKTTLLESIEGLRKIQKGSITVLGQSINSDYKMIQKKIGIQLQRTSLFDDLTVLETLRLYFALYDVKIEYNDHLNKVDLYESANKKIKNLSGGQFQRLNLCLATINNPEIVFLDEPTTGLDPHARRNLWEIVGELAKKKVTILLTTHYMEEAQELCDNIIIINEGTVVAHDSPDNLINQLEIEKTIVVEINFELDQALLESLNLLISANYKIINNQLYIYTYDIGNTLNSLFNWVKHNNKKVENINIRSANLEDVFIKYTSATINKEGALI